MTWRIEWSRDRWNVKVVTTVCLDSLSQKWLEIQTGLQIYNGTPI